jgi:hypothetical protein
MAQIKSNKTHSAFIIGILILASVIFFNANTVLADDTAMGRMPEGVYSINDNDIVMVSEDIYVDVKNGKAKCIFEFKNTGKAKNVLMGFPAEMKDYEQPIMDLSVRNFKVFINKFEIPVQLEKNIKPSSMKEEELFRYDSWHTFNVPFDENETKIVENTYTFKSSVCSVGPGQVRTGYILETGANWKGNIGRARVYFDMGDIRFTNIETLIPEDMECFKFDGDNLVFEKKDFEPNFNLEINYYLYQKDIKFNDDEYGRQLKKVQEEQENRYADIKSFIKNTKPEEILEKFKETYKDGQNIEINYLYSVLPKEYRIESKPQIEELKIYYKQIRDENTSNKAKESKETINNKQDDTQLNPNKVSDKNNKIFIMYVAAIVTIIIGVVTIYIRKTKRK